MNWFRWRALALLALMLIAIGAHGWSDSIRAETPLTISPTGEIAIEVNDPQALTLSLGAEPSNDLTAILVATDPTVVGLSVGTGEPQARVTLTFTTSNWQTDQTVTITGLAPGTTTIAQQVSGGGGQPSYRVLQVTVKAKEKGSVSTLDDCLDNSTTACSIVAPTSASSPTTASGELEVEHDVDWFSVSLASGAQYRIQMQDKDLDRNVTLDRPRILGVYDADGVFIPGTLPAGVARNLIREIEFRATNAGTHYIALSHAESWFANVVSDRPPDTGTYTLKLSLKSQDDCLEAPSTACFATHGTPFSGEIQAPTRETNWIDVDRDWIGVDMTAGVQYQVDLEGQSNSKGTLRNPELSIMSYELKSDGTLQLHNLVGTGKRDQGIGRNDRISFVAPRTGRHYFIVQSDDYRSFGTYVFTFSQLSSRDDDFSDQRTGSPIGSITLNNGSGSANGKIEIVGDTDWFKVGLTGGQHYLIKQAGGRSYILGIYDSAGVQLQPAQYSPGDSWQTFTPAQTGTYYIHAGSRRSFDAVGGYVVSVRQLPADDLAADTSTTSNLIVGGRANGVIGTLQDVDWHRAQLTAGTEYVFDIAAHYGGNPKTGVGSFAGDRHSLLGWNLTTNVFFGGLYDSGGNELTNAAKFGDSPYRITFTPKTSGTYYVSTKTEFSYYHLLGNYTVSLQTSATATLDDFPANTSTTGVLTIAPPLKGRIDYIQDADYIKVALVPGRAYSFPTVTDRYRLLEQVAGSENQYRYVEHPGNGRLQLSSYGKLYNSAGVSVYATWSRNGHYCYRVPTAGDYYIEVKGIYYGIGGYEVRIVESGC